MARKFTINGDEVDSPPDTVVGKGIEAWTFSKSDLEYKAEAKAAEIGVPLLSWGIRVTGYDVWLVCELEAGETEYVPLARFVTKAKRYIVIAKEG